MDISGLFTGSLGILIFRHAYVYFLPGSVALMALSILTRVLRAKGLLIPPIPPFAADDLMGLVAAAIAAYLLGVVIDALMRQFFSRGVDHNPSAQRQFRTLVLASLKKRGSPAAPIIRDKLSSSQLQLMQEGKDLSSKDFSQAFDDAMSAIDTQCRLKDAEAFQAFSMPTNLATLFSRNLSLSFQFLSLSLATVTILLIPIASCLPRNTPSVLSLALYLFVAAVTFSVGLLLRKRAANTSSLLVNMSFRFLEAS